MRSEQLPTGPVVVMIEDPSRLPARLWRELEAAGVRVFGDAPPILPLTPLEQLRKAVAAGDVDTAERLLRAAGPQLPTDHPELLEPWLGTMSAPDLDSRPALRWSMLISAIGQDRRERLPALLRHVLSDQDRRRGGVERALTRGLRCAVQRRLARPEAVATAVALDSMLHDIAPADRAELEPWLPALHYECGMSLLAGGRVLQAHSVLERGTALTLTDWWQRVLDVTTATAEIVLGRVNDARRRREHCPEVGRPHPCDDLVIAVDAALALEADDVESARTLMAACHPTIEHRSAIGLVRALVDLTDGDIAQARDHVARCRHIAAESLGLTDAFSALSTMTSLSDGSGPRGYADGTASTVARAHAALVAGDLDQVRELVACISDDGRSVTPRRRLHAAVLEFALVRRIGSAELAAAVAIRMNAVVARHGITWPLRLLPPEDARAYAEITGTTPLRSVLATTSEAVRLTDRERALLRELLRGGTEQRIAERQHVSINTIKSQRRSLYRKLGVHDRDEAVARALELGVLTDDSRASSEVRVKSGVKNP